MTILAIDIGGTKFSMAAFDENRPVERVTRATDREGGREWMLAQIETIAREWSRSHRFEACGIGFGGPVDFASQTVALSTHVGGWQNTSLTALIGGLLHIPVIMDNDANVGALGEGVYGAGQGCRPLFYMTLSTGIGGGILTENGIYRGADSWAGEIGHMPVRPDGPECLCGARGCFERMCAGLWLGRDNGRPAKELMDDPGFVRRYVVDLALGLKTCIMLLIPARIVIGGGIGKAGDKLFGPLREELRRQITAWSGARIDVMPAALGDDSVLYGALALAKGTGHL
jgi:glucokinase